LLATTETFCGQMEVAMWKKNHDPGINKFSSAALQLFVKMNLRADWQRKSS